eukprot:gene35055-42455_t
MGGKSSKVVEYPKTKEVAVLPKNTSNSSLEKNKNSISTNNALADIQIHHYMPSTFPLHPVLTEEYLVYCRRSWKLLVEQRSANQGSSIAMQGITDFYN